jgi:hypothetical protein
MLVRDPTTEILDADRRVVLSVCKQHAACVRVGGNDSLGFFSIGGAGFLLA